MSSSSDPPPPNPVLTAYEGFIQRTPLVTRSILSIQVVSYIFSWFVNPHYALANIPQFTLFQFEIYRVLLSPLVNTSFFSLIFAFLSFMEHGKRLEHSLGSTAFAWLCMTIGCLTNVAFLLLSLVLYLLSGQDTAYMFASAAGIWLILFGIIAIECIQAPRIQTRRLFFFEVPVLYYPFAIYLFFALLSASLSFPYLLSIGVGYAYGYGFLDKTRLSASKAKQWEETILANFTSREGWVVGHAATGSDAWNESSETGMVRRFIRFEGNMHSFKLIDMNLTHVTTYFSFSYFYRPCPRSRRLKLPAGETIPQPERHERDPSFVRVLPVARTVARPQHLHPQRGDGLWEEAPRVAEMRTHGQRDSRR
jgi:membrane associated rhomboid family serine protease